MVPQQIKKMHMCVCVYTHIHTHIHTHTTHTLIDLHTMESFSEKKEALLSDTTWIHLKSIMLSKISQKTKINTLWYHLHLESLK